MLSVCWRPVLCVWKWNELNTVGADCCWNVQAAFAFLVGDVILSPQGPSLICREECTSGSMLAAGMCWPCMGELNNVSAGYNTLGTAIYKLDYEIYSHWCTWPVKVFYLRAVFLLKIFYLNAGRFLCWSEWYLAQCTTSGIHVCWLSCGPVAKWTLSQVWRVTRMLLSPARWSGKPGSSASFPDLLLHLGAVTTADWEKESPPPVLAATLVASVISGLRLKRWPAFSSHAVPGSRLLAAFPLSGLCS